MVNFPFIILSKVVMRKEENRVEYIKENHKKEVKANENE
jgi:hypothetical protein